MQEVFKGRLIFPIFDIKNNTLGFGARALFNSKAKYINSPNSVIFQKSQILNIQTIKNQKEILHLL